MTQDNPHQNDTQVDDAVDYRSTVDRPGALRGEVWITIQTRQAQRLVIGRKPTQEKAGIIGLTRFGALTSMLNLCARLDDPYADWWLVKIEDTLEQAAHEIQHLRQHVETLLTNAPGMQIDIAQTLDPVRIPLKFGNPYAYQGARLLTDFDALVRTVLTARHVGFMDRDSAEKTLNLGGRAVRRALASAMGFKNQSTRRKDIEENTAHARQAIELMGEVPEEILNRTRRAKLAPELVSKTTARGLKSEHLVLSPRKTAFTLQSSAKPTQDDIGQPSAAAVLGPNDARIDV